MHFAPEVRNRTRPSIYIQRFQMYIYKQPNTHLNVYDYLVLFPYMNVEEVICIGFRFDASMMNERSERVALRELYRRGRDFVVVEV